MNNAQILVRSLINPESGPFRYCIPFYHLHELSKAVNRIYS